MAQKISTENKVSPSPKEITTVVISYIFLLVKLKLMLKINSNKIHTIQNKVKTSLTLSTRIQDRSASNDPTYKL